jgi:hypothetical protein
MKRFAGQYVSLWYAAGDKESETFAREIAASLNAAKWKVLSPASLMTLAENGHPFGSAPPLRVGVNISASEDTGSQDASKALVENFKSMGFDAFEQAVERNRQPIVIVNIDPRPEGPQGAAKLRRP